MQGKRDETNYNTPGRTVRGPGTTNQINKSCLHSNRRRRRRRRRTPERATGLGLGHGLGVGGRVTHETPNIRRC